MHAVSPPAYTGEVQGCESLSKARATSSLSLRKRAGVRGCKEWKRLREELRKRLEFRPRHLRRWWERNLRSVNKASHRCLRSRVYRTLERRANDGCARGYRRD